MAGMLRRVLNLGPYLDIQEPDENGGIETVKRFPLNRFINRIVWGGWRRLPAKVRGHPPAVVTAWLADRLLSHWVDSSSLFHGYTGVCLVSLQAAKNHGAITLVEHAARHPRDWQSSADEECRRFGGKTGATIFPERLIARIDRELQLCNYILVPSTVAYESLARAGYAEKTLILPTGVDTNLFSPDQTRPCSEKFRVCYMGRVELVKGIGYLLQAWKRLRLPDAELVLVGEVKPDAGPLLASYADSTVRTVGLVSPAEVVRYYRESSVFVFPSANEGLGQALLEAMASGLMVVASEWSGARECVADGKEGLIVPAQDVDSLANALLWSYQHRDDVDRMGRAARARIEAEFTLDHYNQRVIALYRSLVERG